MHPWYYRHNQGKNIYRNKDIHYLQKFPYVSLLSFSFSSPFLKITQRATEWCCSLRSHLTTSVVYRCPTTLLASFRYASTPLFLFLHFLKQSASIWRFIRDSFLSLADSKPPIYNDKNAEENSGGIKFWIGKTLWVILHCVLLSLLFAFLHQITALHSVLSQLSLVSATFCSCKSSCCFHLPFLTRGCHLVQPRKSI